MLFDTIGALLVGILTGVLALIPSYDWDLSGLGGGFGSALAGANSVFPVVTLGACLAVIVGLRVFLGLVALVAWVWAKIPFTFK